MQITMMIDEIFLIFFKHATTRTNNNSCNINDMNSNGNWSSHEFAKDTRNFQGIALWSGTSPQRHPIKVLTAMSPCADHKAWNLQSHHQMQRRSESPMAFAMQLCIIILLFEIA